MSEERVTYNLCTGWGCHEHCTLEVHTKDGEITRIQRLVTPGKDPCAQLCMKGVLAARIPYAEDRVLYPLKRAGERGEGKWERISWEQALDEIAEKIKKATDEYGPRTLLLNRFFCGYPGDMRSIPFDYITRFGITMDAGILEYQPVDYSMIYGATVDHGFLFGGMSRELKEAGNMIVIWGGNPLGYTRPAHTSRLMLDAQERGTKIVHISNMFDVTSAKADQWIHVNSGTDAALGLGIAHVLIRDGLVNREFLIGHTSAAYLVRTDTGKYLRESDIVAGGSDQMFCFADTDGNVKTVPYKGMMEPFAGFGGAEVELDACMDVNGIECKSAFRMLKDHVAKWTPEYQQEVTGVDAETIVAFAHEYQAASPSTLYAYYGMRYRNGAMGYRGAMLMAYLTGNIGQPNGGTVIMAGDQTRTVPYGVDDKLIQLPEGFDGTKGDIIHFMDVLDGIEDPSKQQYKVWINFMGNPLINWPNKNLWRNRILPNMDLFVSCEIRLTDTAKYADYVLPDLTSLERWELMTESDECAILTEPAIEPQGEARDYVFVINELAKRLGVGDQFGWTTEQLVELKANQGLAGKEAIVYDEEGNEIGTEPFSFEMMKERKIARVKLPEGMSLDSLAVDAFPTTTGRLEFYNENLVGLGEMVDLHPTYFQEFGGEEYPLQFYAARHKYFMQGQYTNIPENRLLAKEQFGVALNPIEAAKRNMVDGEIVMVESPHGSMKVPLQLRDDVPVGMAHTWYSYNEDEYKESGCPQDVMQAEAVKERSTAFQRTIGPWFSNVQYALGLPHVLHFECGPTTPECIFPIRISIDTGSSRARVS